MALQLNENFKGIQANYWRIRKEVVDTITNKVTIRLSLYKDKSTRLMNVNNFLKEEVFEFDGSDNTREDIYELIKQPVLEDGENINKFVDATDVLEQ